MHTQQDQQPGVVPAGMPAASRRTLGAVVKRRRVDDAAKAPKDPVKAHAQRQRAVLLMFAIGMAMLLHGGTLLFDQIGPSITRQATITGRHIEVSYGKHHRREEDHVVQGRDDHGGVFELDVSTDEYRDVTVGETVTIERSLLTGRVVRIDGPDWALGRQGLRVVMFAVIAFGGLLILFFCVRSHLRREWPDSSPARRRRTALVAAGVSCAITVAIGIWVSTQREDANLGDAPATASEPASGVDDCSGLDHVMEFALLGKLVDKTFTRADMDIALVSVRADAPGCSTSQATKALCDAVRNGLTAFGGDDVVIDPGLCPGV